VEIKLSGPADPVVKRMFYLAWKAVGGPSGMMGFLQDRGEADEDAVWENVQTSGDYLFGREPDPATPGKAHGDYVFGRMMKMCVNWSGDTITVSDYELRRDYQAWCDEYKTYADLAKAAAHELGVGIVAPATYGIHGGSIAPDSTPDALGELVKEQTVGGAK
jgi:hypothetical protein